MSVYLKSGKSNLANKIRRLQDIKHHKLISKKTPTASATLQRPPRQPSSPTGNSRLEQPRRQYSLCWDSWDNQRLRSSLLSCPLQCKIKKKTFSFFCALFSGALSIFPVVFVPELGTANVIHQDKDQAATPFHIITGHCQHSSSRWRSRSYSLLIFIQTWTLPTQFIKMKIQKLLTTQFHIITGHCQLNSSRWRLSRNSISTRSGHCQHDSSRWRSINYSVSYQNWALPTGNVVHQDEDQPATPFHTIIGSSQHNSRWRLSSNSISTRIGHFQHDSSRWRSIMINYSVSYQNWALPIGNVIHQDEDQTATAFHTRTGHCQLNLSRWRPSSYFISTRIGHCQHNS